ncbi:hypothetical protein [Xanthomonas citri]|uniref:hypothetical protein n=1 Tax=Xanthomonas citri TaxID=346 RepID=UPI0004E60F9F|nr:hypothetical protein [Xanthomonas citri]PNV27618.1 hypothetical protein xavtCFBP7764_17795 [Xanthomonas citri]WPM76338.1 hypothetical protein XVT_19775 [Xanthomonas citri pv. viticola]
MPHSIRSTQRLPSALSLPVVRRTANDPVAAHPLPLPVASEFRCGFTGTRNRDIWCALPDIRSARDTRRLQHLAKSGVLFAAAAAVFGLAAASCLMH